MISIEQSISVFLYTDAKIKIQKQTENGDKIMKRIQIGKLFSIAGLFIHFAVAFSLLAEAQGTVLGASQGERSIPDAGVIPQITVNGEEAYSMFAQAALPQNTPFHRAESYEDAGMEALLYAGYPFDGLGLQKKYGVSDDFARVITQQAIWSYIEGWPIDSSDGSIRTRYIKDLLQAAENQTPQEHPVLLSPESPSFRLQGGFYRSETLTLTQADGSIAIHPENGIQVLDEDGSAVTTLHQGDRFILVAPENLPELSLPVTHLFQEVVAVHYIPDADNPKMDHLLRAEAQETTRGGTWHFSLPEQPLSAKEPTVSHPAESMQAPSYTSAPTETTEIATPDTGDDGMPFTAAALLGLCWVASGLIFLGKRSKNGNR